MEEEHRQEPPPIPRGSDAAPPVRVAIVDNETGSRERWRRLFESAAGVELVGAGSRDADVVALAKSLNPDVIFVAHHPPELNALTVSASISPTRRPAVVMLATDKHHAFQAYEAGILDYLLWPASGERFARTLERVRTFGDDRAAAHPTGASRRLQTCRQRLVVKISSELVFVYFHEIHWIESAGNNVRLHTAVGTLTTRESLKAIEARLDGRFLRIHRTSIVNAERIRRISVDEGGHPWVSLKDGTRLSAGRYIDRPLRQWMDEGR